MTNTFLRDDGTFQPITGAVLSFTQPETGAVTRTIQSKLQDIVSILDFGADPTGVVDSTTAIQNAVNAVSSGGIVLIPGSGYNASGPITITNPCKIIGSSFLNSSTGTINCTSTTNDLFIINSSYVTMEGLYLNRAGSPTAGRAIAIGTDYRAITDAEVTSGQNTLTSPAQANFVNAAAPAGDIGKSVYFAGAGAAGGALFASITAVNSPTVAVMSVNAGTTIASGGHCQYGLNYQEIVIRDVQMVNHYIGLQNLASVQLHIDHIYAEGKYPIIHENRLWSDQGDSFLSNSTFYSTDQVAGTAFQYLSGGGLKVNNNKFLFGLYNIQIIWAGQSSASMHFCNNSCEGAATGSLYVASTVLIGRVHFSNNYFSSTNGPVVQFDTAAAAVATDVTFVGNSVYSATATLGMDLGQVTYFDIGDNVIDLSGGGLAYAVRSNAANGRLETGIARTAELITCASTSALIDSNQGDVFAHIPASAANGSRFYVTDGTPGASVSGGGSGSLAIRQGVNTWKGL